MRALAHSPHAHTPPPPPARLGAHSGASGSTPSRAGWFSYELKLFGTDPTHASAGWFTYELKMFWCVRGLIFDMTELANCQGFTEAAHRSGFRFNSHVNPYARWVWGGLRVWGG